MSGFSRPVHDPDREPPATPDERVRVLIAGAGAGGLEAALALRTYRDRVRVSLLCDEPCFTYRPLAVGAPFGGASVMEMNLVEFAAEQEIDLVVDGLDRVDAAAKRVVTRSGAELAYDVLLLAVGGKSRTAIPGALTFRGPQDVVRLRDALLPLGRHSSANITFVAATSTTWTLPLYELALLTDAWSRERSLAPTIRIVTAEREPMEMFGTATSQTVGELLRSRGISIFLNTPAGFVGGGQLWIPMGGAVRADLAIALASLEGPAIQGLPADEHGFVPVDDFCRVKGLSDVYAVGDMTAGGAKQGGLATQMADAAADSIAWAAGAPVTPTPFAPSLNALLFTGEESISIEDGALVAGRWPPDKIAGKHLGPYLATHADFLAPARA